MRPVVRIIAGAMALALVAPRAIPASAATTLLNASYDSTRELYAELNTRFAAYWKRKTGEDVVIHQSHGGSGAQARAVIEGLDADVVTLALARDIDAIAKRSGELPRTWAKRLPDNSSPYTSTIVFLVRRGNPKRIHDWPDLARDGVSVVAPNPKTSGSARWNVLAAYAYGLKRNHNDDRKARALLAGIYRNVPVFDTGSRAAELTFTEREIGDVLVGWENDAILAVREHPGAYEIVAPSISVLAEPPVAWIDANVAKHHTQALAKAYLVYLYSDDGQQLACTWGYRPRDARALRACATHFARIERVPIAAFGGWTAAQKRFFADGGVFDRVTNRG